MDYKGRVLIPIYIRKKLNLKENQEVIISIEALEPTSEFFSVRNLNGRDGVADISNSERSSGKIKPEQKTYNMGDCGSPEAGSNQLLQKGCENPAPDPKTISRKNSNNKKRSLK